MKIGNKIFNFGERTFIMGILNVTPDSFSDGGKFDDLERALLQAEKMVSQGADIIDVGGESTRPDYIPISSDEELNRVIPVIEALKTRIEVPISIDTYKSVVAESAIKAGADLINDVWGFKKDKFMANVAARYQVPCCIMHNRDNKNYDNLMEDIAADLKESIKLALYAGVKRENVIVDPGIGFAKNYDQNLTVMNELEKLKELGFPMLLGTSRKSFIGTTLSLTTEQRVEGTIATTVIGIMKGCDFIRVHDVLQNKRAALMTDAIVRRR